MRRLFLALAAIAATLALAPRVSAFCRTTTEPIPPGYDPTRKGCIDTGTPLAWPSMPVTYQVQAQASRQVSYAEATPIIDTAFAQWAGASCSAKDPTIGPLVSFQNAGPTDAGYAPCDGGPCGAPADSAPHVILFRDDVWPYNDPSNTLALTTVTFGVDTGHIYDADMEINTHEHKISVVSPPANGTFSLEAIVTHEAGHFIGLAHSQIDTAIMYAHYQPGAIALTADDVDAVCAAYAPESPASPAGCGCEQASAGAGGIATTAAALAIVAAILRRLRRAPC